MLVNRGGSATVRVIRCGKRFAVHAADFRQDGFLAGLVELETGVLVHCHTLNEEWLGKATGCPAAAHEAIKLRHSRSASSPSRFKKEALGGMCGRSRCGQRGIG